MSSSSDADNVSQGQRAHHRHHQLSLSSRPSSGAPIIVIIGCHCPLVHPPRLTSVAGLLLLLIVKFPTLGSILVSLNSDAFGTDVGGGIVLGIVISVAILIQDGLRCHPQESAPPTVIDDVSSYAPPPSSIFVRSSIIASPSNSRGGRISAMGVSCAVHVSKKEKLSECHH